MARALDGRLRLAGDLVATTALHVGAAASAPGEGDLVLSLDGADRPVVPGTSLAGALRSWALRSAVASDDVRWVAAVLAAFGFQGEGEDGHASHLIVEDAPVTSGATAELRDGVGIDRGTGTAARRLKFDRLVVPRGARFAFELTLELPSEPITLPAAALAQAAEPFELTPRPPGPGEPADQDREQWRDVTVGADELRALMARLVEDLLGGRLRIGAATTRGLGRVVLDGATTELREEALADREGMLDALRARLGVATAPDSADEPVRAIAGSLSLPAPPTLVEIEVEWEPDAAVLVAATLGGLAVDIVPLTTLGPAGGGRALLLPGSSLKGVVRSHAERLVRTVLDIPDVDDPWASATGIPLEEQVDLELVSELFGRAPRVRDGAAIPGRRAAVAIADCHSKHGVGDLAALDADAWRTAQTAAEGDPDPVDGEGAPAATDEAAAQRALRAAGLSHAAVAAHVAVERWTAAPVQGALYTVAEPHGTAWEPLQLTIDPLLLPAERRNAALALLWLTLRDLSDGALAFGYGTNRGHGGVRAGATITVAGGEALGLADGALAFAEPPEVLLLGWWEWLEQQERATR